MAPALLMRAFKPQLKQLLKGSGAHTVISRVRIEDDSLNFRIQRVTRILCRTQFVYKLLGKVLYVRAV
ncbi:hypothetical protein D3C81_1230030 [compost metagenome]